jgi:hypothetical protein
MASMSNDRKQCLKCGSRGWVFPCEGCNASFCISHAPGHRLELIAQLDNIEHQSNHLEQIYNQHEKRQEHPLFSQIDVWEHDTIARIQQTAQIARNELRQLLDDSNNRMKAIFNQFNIDLHAGRENDHFTEIELTKWNEQLTNIRKQLETPGNTELIEDKNLPPIHLIKVNTTNQTTMITIPSFSQPIQSNEDTNNPECFFKDNLDKPQLLIIDNQDTTATTTRGIVLLDRSLSRCTCILALTTNESSVIPIEGPTTALCSSELASADFCRLLDPTKNINLVILQLLPPTNQSQLPTILNQLADRQLQVFNQKEDCLNQLNCSEQATVFIDISDVLSEEENCLLDNISELDNVYYIYIRGILPDDAEERDRFFRRYSKIKATFDNDQQLMVQWAIDTANEYKKTGDDYVKRGDKDRGRSCFEQGIALYKHLSEFLNRKRNVR